MVVEVFPMSFFLISINSSFIYVHVIIFKIFKLKKNSHIYCKSYSYPKDKQ